MAKRSVISSDDQSSIEFDISRVEREFNEIEAIAEEIAVSEPEHVMIRNLIPSLVTWRSPKTGESYRWDRSGSEVKVLRDDVEFLLAHRRKGCCGAPDSPSFELVK